MKARGLRTMLVSPGILVEMFKGLHDAPIYEKAIGLPKDTRLEHNTHMGRHADNIQLILSSEEWAPKPLTADGLPPEVTVMFHRDGWKAAEFSFA